MIFTYPGATPPYDEPDALAIGSGLSFLREAGPGGVDELAVDIDALVAAGLVHLEDGDLALPGDLGVAGVSTFTGAVHANGGLQGTTGEFTGEVSAGSADIEGGVAAWLVDAETEVRAPYVIAETVMYAGGGFVQSGAAALALLNSLGNYADVYMAGLVAGSASFAGLVSATAGITGTFASFTGALSAASGAFTGAVSAASGAFGGASVTGTANLLGDVYRARLDGITDQQPAHLVLPVGTSPPANLRSPTVLYFYDPA